MRRKFSKWHNMCFFGAVQRLLHLWLIVITFMVGSDYYIYGGVGYYTYG